MRGRGGHGGRSKGRSWDSRGSRTPGGAWRGRCSGSACWGSPRTPYWLKARPQAELEAERNCTQALSSPSLVPAFPVGLTSPAFPEPLRPPWVSVLMVWELSADHPPPIPLGILGLTLSATLALEGSPGRLGCCLPSGPGKHSEAFLADLKTPRALQDSPQGPRLLPPDIHPHYP